MGKRIPMEGNIAVANAMRQINPDIVAAYPITPQTETVQAFAKFVADGLVDTDVIRVESEHSAMSACIGAGAAGARVFTATSANGMALMWEMLYIAASLRLPIVMAMVNRALSGNINIHCDHSDSMGARDSGWIQIYAENGQEAYDNFIQSVRIAEAARLPVMCCYDGFIISHAFETLEVEDDAAVRAFVGDYTPAYNLLDIEHPITVGPLDLFDFYFEHKISEIKAYKPAQEAIIKVGKEFGATFGREYGLFEAYELDDAEEVIVCLSSTAGSVKDVIDEMRAEGRKVGLLKPRLFRPFPAKEYVEALSGAKSIAVLDRAESFGAYTAPLYTELAAAMKVFGKDTPMINYVYGLGGREINLDHIRSVYADLVEAKGGVDPANVKRFLGVRGEVTL